MVARTSTWKGSPEALERWAEHVNNHARLFVASLPGNAGAVFLIDRKEAVGLTLTLWDSEAAALVTDAGAEKSRASSPRPAWNWSREVSTRCSRRQCPRQCDAAIASRSPVPLSQAFRLAPAHALAVHEPVAA